MRRLLCLLALLSLAVATLPAGAGAKTKAKLPAISKVSPMRVAVGRTITIRGKNFSSSKRRNTVVFRGPGKRSAFAKPSRASRSKLVVRVPGSVEGLLRRSGTKRIATRFSLRVITKRYGRLTIRRHSPVIVSATDSGNLNCGTGSDWDGDLLSNEREKALGTDPCLKDTDMDGVEDYFEVESALDLNQRAVPYPGKRPYPNPLDPSDANYDFDGDGLSMTDEYRAWAKAPAPPAPALLHGYSSKPWTPLFGGPYGSRPTFGGHSPVLNYSDGMQATRNITPSDPEYRWYLDLNGDNRLTDDERDVDGDGLGNWVELYGLMRIKYYPPANTEDPMKDYGADPAIKRTWLEPNYLDPDTDGDGVLDGNDDQDNDDVSNVDEILPPYQYIDKKGPYPVNRSRNSAYDPRIRSPYNACWPDPESRACNRYIPGG